MLELLGISVLALTALSAVFLVALVFRRSSLAREEQRRETLEERVRPFALALVDGEAVVLPELSTEERATLAEAIGRLSRNLTGDARARIGTYFAGTTAYAAEVAALRERRVWRRATAAYRLGDMACPEAVPELLPALEDRDADVRAAAARSLGRLGRPEAAEPLVRVLVDGTVPRALAFRAVLDLGPAALPALRVLSRADDPDERAEPAEQLDGLGALGRLASEEGAEALTQALDDRIYFVRLQAARALGQVGERAAVPRLIRQAREDRFEAARAAAQAVARVDPEALLDAAAEPDAGPHLHEAADLLRV